jgi:hypothetical protein
MLQPIEGDMVLKSIALLSAIAFGVVGCDVQRGRFTTSGVNSLAFSSHLGCIDIVDGYGAKPFNEKDAVEQHLLYVMIVCSGVQEFKSGSNSDYGKYVTTLNHTWDTKTGTLAVSIHWDRQADTVAIGKQKFTREKGNVFVVRLEANKEIVGQQLTSVGPHADFQQLLEHVHQMLPNDELIASLKLHEQVK